MVSWVPILGVIAATLSLAFYYFQKMAPSSRDYEKELGKDKLMVIADAVRAASNEDGMIAKDKVDDMPYTLVWAETPSKQHFIIDGRLYHVQPLMAQADAMRKGTKKEL